MSGQTELTLHFERLSEISGIMTAMKTLALVETKKLSRFIGHQRRMLSNIEAAAADFSAFHPIVYDKADNSALIIAIGSERGFCGNFNEQIAEVFAKSSENGLDSARMIIVGNRLGMKLENVPDVIKILEGATVAEDIPRTIDRLMDSLEGASALYVLSHEAEGETVFKRLLPFSPPVIPPAATPPLMQLTPENFLIQLLDQYLLSVLYGLLYESLLSESRHRLTHMEHALDRLKQTISDLSLKRNALRQEKIIEEIEVILAGRQPTI